MQASDRLIRRSEVEHRTGLSCSAIYRRMEKGTFPKPVSVGGNTVRWRESEVAGWIESRPPAAVSGRPRQAAVA